MTEASSNTIFVVENRLPWPDDSSALGEKGEFESGALINSGVRTPCSIRKISALGATLVSDQTTAAGSEVAVELATGQRPGGTIDWVDRRELGIRFDEPLDVLALINRKLVSQPVERRTMPRVELRCAVHIKYARALPAGDAAQYLGARAADRRRAAAARRNLCRAVRRRA